jgi:hypothetical protein
LTQNFLKQKPEPIFRKQKLGKPPPLKKPDLIEAEILLKTKTLFCKTQNANLKHNLFLKNCLKIECKFLPTVCVTCAGAGGGTPSERKNAQA